MDRPGIMELFHTTALDVLRWTSSQQFKVSIFPGGKHQDSEDELCVVRELDDECPRGHELVRMDLERLPPS
jgi:hypothetical protein